MNKCNGNILTSYGNLITISYTTTSVIKTVDGTDNPYIGVSHSGDCRLIVAITFDH